MFAIKAAIGDPRAEAFAFGEQKTMYGGKRIAIRRTAHARRRLGRSELKPFADWGDGRPETELNFKFYRQATNKIVGISHEAIAFLRGFF